jgi:hypothetical protein
MDDEVPLTDYWLCLGLTVQASLEYRVAISGKPGNLDKSGMLGLIKKLGKGEGIR